MREKIVLMGIAFAFMGLVAFRVWRYSTSTTPTMPEQLVEGHERELLLTPGGKYTVADIASNGQTIPSLKYCGFLAQHDIDVKPGDTICPVTRTKANPQCTWKIGGLVYEFCCPPCIAEFVQLAKQHPERIQPPEAYEK